MGKVKKTRDSSTLGRSLIKDKSKRNKGTPNEDGWVSYHKISTPVMHSHIQAAHK